MYVHREESTCGRLVPKPEKEGQDEDEHFDDVIPIQDQIENLRTKIILKEKYNRVLSEDFEESRQGASSILFNLYRGTHELRIKLMTSLKSEEICVEKALRTHREFQMAHKHATENWMRERGQTIAIPWLDDKLFDYTKTFNVLLCHLAEKRLKLEEAERMVLMIEKWPRPGTLPWEVAALERFEQLDNIIENTKIKAETSFILHSKYYSIKYILREEQGKYPPTLRALENQLIGLKNELADLHQMLDEAIYFRDDSYKELVITEKEASENRKQRRKQMAKMKKAVDKVLTENQHLQPSGMKVYMNSKMEESDETSYLMDELKYKREIVAQYRDRARRLVDVMRVSDLTRIPHRSKTVARLGVRLKRELETKEQFRNVLLGQKNQLMLLFNKFKHSGQQREMEFQKRMANYTEAIGLVRADLSEADVRMQRYGNLFVDIRLSILATLGRLDAKHRHETIYAGDLKGHMRTVYVKIKKLIKAIKRFEDLFAAADGSERQYDQYVKVPALQPRFVRIGSPEANDESEEEEMADLKVPTRQDIKNKSLRVIQQSILRRGLR